MYFYDKESNKQTNKMYIMFFQLMIFNRILAENETFHLYIA